MIFLILLTIITGISLLAAGILITAYLWQEWRSHDHTQGFLRQQQQDLEQLWTLPTRDPERAT